MTCLHRDEQGSKVQLYFLMNAQYIQMDVEVEVRTWSVLNTHREVFSIYRNNKGAMLKCGFLLLYNDALHKFV